MNNCFLEQLVLTPAEEKTIFRLVRRDHWVLIEILHRLPDLARESCVQVWLLRNCHRGNPIWQWAYLEFSITIREVVSSRLRTRNEWKKLWQRSREFWHLPKNPGVPIRSVSGQRGQSSVFWVSIATLLCIAQNAHLPHHQALLDTNIAWWKQCGL